VPRLGPLGSPGGHTGTWWGGEPGGPLPAAAAAAAAAPPPDDLPAAAGPAGGSWYPGPPAADAAPPAGPNLLGLGPVAMLPLLRLLLPLPAAAPAAAAAAARLESAPPPPAAAASASLLALAALAAMLSQGRLKGWKQAPGSRPASLTCGPAPSPAHTHITRTAAAMISQGLGAHSYYQALHQAHRQQWAPGCCGCCVPSNTLICNKILPEHLSSRAGEGALQRAALPFPPNTHLLVV
jgi:hypothetical protein